MNTPADSSSRRSTPVEGPLRRGTVVTALALSMLIFGLQIFSSRFPSPRPDDAPADEFSAGRAADVLGELLAENVPHPVGSAENRRVKERIVVRLEALGAIVEEQRTVGCHRRVPRCAFVENVLAKIPGRGPGPAVLLMAHYDSVPMSPGAGDDGAGVAALLEVARILAAEAPFRNPVILAFTDAEELGLLGAEAFFGQHPWAEEVGVVLNVEGSGSEGESLLLRTGPDSRWVVDAFRRSVRHPSAFSVADEVFKHMPNDTDFSVAQRAGLPGIDFSFAGERNHYHSPLDTLENLSRVTLQHHGENVLPLTRELASMDLTGHAGGDKLYHSLGQVMTITWNQGNNVPLAVLGFLLLAAAAVTVVRGGETSGRRIAVGTLASLLTVLAVVLFNLGVFKVLALLNGTTVAWPAQEWPFRLCLAATTLAAALTVTWALGRFLDFWSSLLGAWIFYLLLAAASVAYLPVAANLFLIPVLGSGLLIVALALWRQLRHRREALAILTLAMATLFTLKPAALFEQTQGYQLIVATFPFVALYVVALHPLLRCADVRPWKPLLASVAVLGVGMVCATALPLYSEWRPQLLNVLHVEDHDQGQAHWMIYSSNPVPPAMADVADFRRPETSILPWSERTDRPVAVAPVTGDAAPVLTVTASPEVEEGRRLSLHLESLRGARHVQLMIPESAGLRSATLAGQSLKVELRSGQQWHRLAVSGVPESGFDLDVEIATSETSEWFVLDWTSELPAAAEALLAARSPLAAPVHRGDQAIVFTRVSI